MFIAGLSIFAEFILILFSVMLLVKQSPVKRTNSILAMAFIFMAGSNCSMSYLHYFSIQQLPRPLSGYVPVHLVLNMLVCPTIYFYVCKLFGNTNLPGRKHILWHALPALPALAYILWFVRLPEQTRIAMLLNHSASTHWIVAALNIIFYVQSVSYLIVCFIRVNKQRNNNYLLQIAGQHTNIRWLYYFFCFASIGLMVCMLCCSISGFNHVHSDVSLTFSNLLIVYLFTQSIWQTGLSMQHVSEIPRKIVPRLVINDQQLETYWNRLIETMEISPVYLSSTCTLKELAEASGIPLHHLSKLINSHQNMNFSEFINKYRVLHACKLFDDTKKQNLTLEAISKECGFGCRSNFSRAFKKHTGQTPHEYQSQLFHTKLLNPPYPDWEPDDRGFDSLQPDAPHLTETELQYL